MSWPTLRPDAPPQRPQVFQPPGSGTHGVGGGDDGGARSGGEAGGEDTSTGARPSPSCWEMQLAVTRLERRCTLRGSRFYITKTKATHFCRRRGTCPSVPLRLHGVEIPLKSSLRFLGVLLDSRLMYREHVKFLTLNCTRH